MASAADNIVVLGTYYDPVEAHLARTRLEAAGIACFLSNEHLAVLNRMYSPAAGGVRLHVYARDVARATEALHEPAVMRAVPGGSADDEPTRCCPRCGSVEVSNEADEPAAGNWWARLRQWLRGQGLLPEQDKHCFDCGLDY